MAIDPGKNSSLFKVDVAPVPWGKCLVDGFLDREAKQGADPPTVWRERRDSLHLFGTQNPRLDAFTSWREVLKIDAEAAMLMARDQRDSHVSLVADGDAEILPGGGSTPWIGQDRWSAAAEHLKGCACSETASDPVDLPVARQIDRVSALFGMKLLQDLNRNRCLGVRK